MAGACLPGTPLIAETGGLNAMIVDSTALPEQAVRDIITVGFSIRRSTMLGTAVFIHSTRYCA
jgi:delta 1-pyrroline-5-carboxylate dehydrogenase